MNRLRLVVLAGTLAAAGCGGALVDEARASARPAAKVKVADEHLARIPIEYLVEVERMREAARQRRDVRARVQHEAAVAVHAMQVADARVIAAAAQEQVATEALGLAKKKGGRRGIDDARAVLDFRKMQRRLAEANAEVARRQHRQAEAELAVASARVALAEAGLEESKFAALVASNDAAADRYKAQDFRRPIDEAQRQLQRNEAALGRAAEGVRESVSRAESLERDLERVPVRGREDSETEPPELDEELDPVPAPTPFR